MTHWPDPRCSEVRWCLPTICLSTHPYLMDGWITGWQQYDRPDQVECQESWKLEGMVMRRTMIETIGWLLITCPVCITCPTLLPVLIIRNCCDMRLPLSSASHFIQGCFYFLSQTLHPCLLTWPRSSPLTEFQHAGRPRHSVLWRSGIRLAGNQGGSRKGHM